MNHGGSPWGDSPWGFQLGDYALGIPHGKSQMVDPLGGNPPGPMGPRDTPLELSQRPFKKDLGARSFLLPEVFLKFIHPVCYTVLLFLQLVLQRFGRRERE